jgi:hypothetical protein
MAPFLYFFDLDGTIIGDITFQIYEWDMIQRFNPDKMVQFKKNVCTQLASGLLRPGFATFLDFLKARHECEFFIYTASESRWANFIISCIETVTSIKFSRPLFTRSHCILDAHENYRKSLKKVLPIAMRKLNIDQNEDMHGKFLFIDNNRVIPRNEESRLILCSTYMYTDPTDIIKLLTEESLQNNHVEIYSIMTHIGLFEKDSSLGFNSTNRNHVQLFKAAYYATLTEYIKENVRDDAIWTRDTFWTRLGNMLHQLPLHSTMKDGQVALINDALRKKG